MGLSKVKQLGQILGMLADVWGVSKKSVRLTYKCQGLRAEQKQAGKGPVLNDG